jgi:hypothetical protein
VGTDGQSETVHGDAGIDQETVGLAGTRTKISHPHVEAKKKLKRGQSSGAVTSYLHRNFLKVQVVVRKICTSQIFFLVSFYLSVSF